VDFVAWSVNPFSPRGETGHRQSSDRDVLPECIPLIGSNIFIGAAKRRSVALTEKE